MKTILVDIDDTVLQFAESFQNWAVERKGYTLYETIRNAGSIQGAINCNEEDVNGLIVEFCEDPTYFRCIEPEKDALQVLPKLHEYGYQFVAISACVNGPTEVANRRHNLETAFGIPWLDIHCTGLLQSKTSYLEKFEPTWWVEDNIKHALVGAELGHKTFIIDRPYNQHENVANLTRVKNWYDIYDRITVGAWNDAA